MDRSMQPGSLRASIRDLRALAERDLGTGVSLFPILDDREAEERWLRDEQVPCWPSARCLVDAEGDDSGCFRANLHVVGSGDIFADARPVMPSGSAPSVASAMLRDHSTARSLADVSHALFFGGGADDKLNIGMARETSLDQDRGAMPEPPKSMADLIERLYEGNVLRETIGKEVMTPLQRQHANFVPCFGLLPSRNDESVAYLLTRESDFHLGTLSKFNRQVLRLFDDNISVDAVAQFDDEPGVAPELLGSDPILDGQCDLPARFLFFQACKALQFYHEKVGIAHGALVPESFSVTENAWVELRLPTWGPQQTSQTGSDDHDGNALRVQNLTVAWCEGKLSTFEYILEVNKAAGRRTGGVGEYHATFPWIRDFDSNNPRDLTKTKYRLKKGDRQLDTTFAGFASLREKQRKLPSPLLKELSTTPHHIPESLSELTYYVYVARIAPIRALQRVVRSNFEPKEYPVSLARLYEWTPDEATIEFFVDHATFLPSKGLSCLLCGNVHDASTEAETFLSKHAALLEAAPREGIAAWLNLNFGAALQGRVAVENKNVVISSMKRKESEHFALVKSPEFIRVFDRPHPTGTGRIGVLTNLPVERTALVSPRSSRLVRTDSTKRLTDLEENEPGNEEDGFLLDVLHAMLAPRDGLRVIIQQPEQVSATFGETVAIREQYMTVGSLPAPVSLPSLPDKVDLPTEPRLTFLGSDLVEWLIRRQIPGVVSTTDAVNLAQRMMNAGFFYPENKEFEDFVDADDVYIFRERKDTSGGASSRKALVGDSVLTISRPLLGINVGDVAIAGLGGIARFEAYYSKASRDNDACALALIIAEMYLGRVPRELADLDLLPYHVGRALRQALESSEPVSIEEWLKDEMIFPRYLHVVHDFLSRVHLADDPISAFCSGLSACLRDCHESELIHEQILWLMAPTALQLMRRNNLASLGSIYLALENVAAGGKRNALLRKLVEAAFEEYDQGPEEETLSWVRYLPVDIYHERVTDAFIHANGKSPTIERALASAFRQGEHGRFLMNRTLSLIKLRGLNQTFTKELTSRVLALALTQENTMTWTGNEGSGRDLGGSEDEGGGGYNTEDDEPQNPVDVSVVSSADAGGFDKNLNTSSQSANYNLQNRPSLARVIKSRFLAHRDAPITAMTLSPSNGSQPGLLSTGTKRGEIALWSLDDASGFSESARVRLMEKEEGVSIQALRIFSRSRSVAVVTSKNGAVVLDSGAGGGATYVMNSLAMVKCIESFPSHPQLVCIGETSGDISVADLRSYRTRSRMVLPSSQGQSVRSVLVSSQSSSIFCSVNERLGELDLRMAGKVVREWRAIGKVSRMFELEGKADKIVTLVRGGSAASVWDSTSTPLPKERLRAYAGFDEDPSSSGPGAGPGVNEPIVQVGDMNPTLLAPFVESFDDCDSLATQTVATDPSEGSFLYSIRGTHKLARIPLKLHDAPLEVRVRPLSLTWAKTNRRFTRGSISLTAACATSGHGLLLASYSPLEFDGSYVNTLT